MSDHLAAIASIAESVEVRREALSFATGILRDAVRDAHLAGVPKVDIARAAGVSRPTVDKWLEEK